MARNQFGADAQTVTFLAGQPYGGVNVTFWTAETGGSPITDLLNAAGTAVTSINSNSDGSMPPFSGPAAGTTSMWSQAGNANERLLIYSLAALAGGGGGGGGVTLTATAIKTANYTAAVGDLARMSAAAASRVTTLPTAPADTSEVGVEVVALTGAFTVTVTCGGTDTFEDGTTSIVLDDVDDVLILEYTASGHTWNIIGDGGVGPLFAQNNLSDLGSIPTALGTLGIATVGTSGLMSDLSGEGNLAQLAPCVPFFVFWNGTAWTYNGSVITARPTTVGTMVSVGNTTMPSFAVVNDIGLQTV